MKVTLACQLFSHTASAAIKTLVQKDILPDEALDTVIFLQVVNDMWDFVNSNCVSAPLSKRAINVKDLPQQLLMFDKFITLLKAGLSLERKTNLCHFQGIMVGY